MVGKNVKMIWARGAKGSCGTEGVVAVVVVPQTAVAWGSHYLLKSRGCFLGANLVLVCDLDHGAMGSKCENTHKKCLWMANFELKLWNLFSWKIYSSIYKKIIYFL